MLRDHAFQPALEAGLEKLDAVLVDVVGHEQVPAGLDRFLQAGPPPHHRLPHQRLLFHIKRVEGQVGDRDLVSHGRASRQPLPQPVVVGTPVLVGGDELAVDHAALRHPMAGSRDLRHHLGHVVQPAVVQMHVPLWIAEEKTAQPVPLHLEDIVGGAEGCFRRGGLHGSQLVGKALELDLQLALVFHESLRLASLSRFAGEVAPAPTAPGRVRAGTN